MSCKMISLDTSSSITGYAKFINAKYISSGTIDLTKIKNSEDRIEEMCLSIIDYLTHEKPDIVVIEMTVVTRNAAAQRLLSIITGVVYGYCIINDCEYVSLRPTEWRKLVSNKDEAQPRKREELKEWSKNKIKELLNIEVSDDESDAILLGFARINQFI